jgi:REP element-mobilizing transposase RayT
LSYKKSDIIPLITMTYYKRHLPHWQPPGRTIFLTWRLYGSLPASIIQKIQRQRNLKQGEAFLKIDRVLDEIRTGPFWLKDGRIASCVVRALRKGECELRQYILHVFVVMPNHVHVLFDPLVTLARITKGLKGATAREANEILGQTGKRFWQDETFDHWIRSAAQLERVQTYIEHNPVSAGLVRTPSDWPWSSASGRTGTLACPHEPSEET